MNRNKLYSFLAIAFAAGYGWLGYQLLSAAQHSHGPTVCLIKNVTGVPCPSCGTTRAVVSIAYGDFGGAFFSNPLGFVVALGLLVGPAWLLYDVISSKSTLWISYQQFEIWLKNPVRAIPLAVLVLINWFWNIYKGI
ncbi:DUF2752 domain-containing protein [Echinicola strongylocentroti]|uniref:DUF2752 domain-containing protein n=1 Tax=Echinicola strongylocentroti TaxID=1795355 RepID=A0A2Z4IJ16_9BACT|nr:DUF2752 domain-containing protein [Echinicola strongylocentroti]AWW30707.1 DUF2752 domain-containing protein [Echinicola strongylocentroti]